MHAILTSTKNEVYKILSKKKFIILFILSIVILISVSSANLIANIRFGGPLLNSTNIPVTVLNFISSMFLPLFVLLLTSDLFSGEFSDNSIIMSLVRPVARNKLYISKILAIGISMLIILMGTFIVSEIVSFMGGGFSAGLAKLPSNLMTYVFAVVPMLLIAVITAFTTQFTKSGNFTVVILICASIIISLVSIIFPEIKTFMPTTYLSWHLNFYGKLNFTKIINELLYILAYGIIFMSAGSYLFYRKDV